MRTRLRNGLLGGLVVAILLAGGAAAQTPGVKTVKITPQIVIERTGGEGFCGAGAAIVWPHVRGATSYTINYTDGGEPRSLGGAGPFDDEPGLTPANSHRKGLAGLNSGGGGINYSSCDDDAEFYRNRFQAKPSTASIPIPDGARILGRVTGPGGVAVAGVAIKASKGKGSLSATTLADGNYAIEVPRTALGTYTVTARKGSAKFEPPKRTVKATRGAIAGADFKQGAYAISGSVTLCTDSCGKADNITVQASGPKGNKTATVSKGAFTIDDLPPGTYTVAPVLAAGQVADPKTRTVTLKSDDVTKQDFCISREEPAPRMLRGDPVGGWASGGKGKELECGKCEIKAKLAGWELKADCVPEDKVDEGVTNVEATPPAGAPVGKLTIPFALPLEDRKTLATPVVLPGLGVNLGGASLSAYENFLTKDGVKVGTAEMKLGNVEASVSDLEIKGSSVSAGSVDLAAYGFGLEGTGVTISAAGLTADQAALGLPPALGGALIGVRGLVIGTNGDVRGQLDRGELSIGGLEVKFRGGRMDGTRMSLEGASLKLPPHLGGSELTATGVAFDFATNEFSVQEAHGALEVDVAGGRVHVKADVNARFFPRGKYAIEGRGFVRVGSASDPFFLADADISVASVDCPTPPETGKCTNARYLQRAGLRVVTDKPIPLGSTGLGIKGISGDVETSANDGRIDAQGNITGVTYLFGLGGTFQTIPDGGFAFDGEIKGHFSTSGNFGVTVNGTTMRYLSVNGGICVRFTADAGDPVCNAVFPERRRDELLGQGVFVGAGVAGGASYGGSLFSATAQLQAQAFGRFASAAGQTYADAEVSGGFTVGANAYILGGVEAGGKLTARIGRFATPERTTKLGIKGQLEGNLTTTGVFGNRVQKVSRAVFIGEDGTYDEDNANQYTLLTPRPSLPRAAWLLAARPRQANPGPTFDIARGQRDTIVVADADAGDPTLQLVAPDGTRVTATRRGDAAPALTLTPPAGKKLTRAQQEGFFAVRYGVPGAVGIYLPAAAAGKWSASVTGVPEGTYSLSAVGQKPEPTLSVSSPGKRVAPTAKRPRVQIAGTLRGAANGARLSVYASGSPCARRSGRLVPEGSGRLVASNVKVSGGRWKAQWNTRGAGGGRYRIYATVDTPGGALVSACAQGSVVVPKGKSAKPRQVARTTPGADAWPPLPPPGPGSGLAYARALARAAANDCRNAAPPKVRRDSEPVARSAAKLAVLTVDPGVTPCIAANNAAAINGTDPSTGGGAATVEKGKYVPYSYRGGKRGGAPDELTNGILSGKPGFTSKDNRREACGGRPFKGSKPGPPAPGHTSCDEYPFASTLEGGNNSGHISIVRGVLVTENNKQGGDIQGMLSRKGNALLLKNSNGKFKVCVVGLTRC